MPTGWPLPGSRSVAPDMFGGQVASTIEDAERLSGSAESPGHRTRGRVDRPRRGRRPRRAPGPDVPVRGARLLVRCRLRHADPGRARSTRGVGRVLRRLHGDAHRAFVRCGAGPLRRDATNSRATRASPSSRMASGRRVARWTIHRYPGTGHWFAEPSRDAYRAEAADLAFDRTVAFLRQASGLGAHEQPIGQPASG